MDCKLVGKEMQKCLLYIDSALVEFMVLNVITRQKYNLSKFSDFKLI